MNESNEFSPKQNEQNNQNEMISEEKYMITKLKYEEEIDELKRTLKIYEEGYYWLSKAYYDLKDNKSHIS